MPDEIDYRPALRRNWILIALIIAVAVLLALVISRSQPRVYESSAQLVVAPGPSSDPANVIRAVETLERRTVVATFARIATTPELKSHAVALAQLPSSDARQFRVTSSVVPGTNILRIDVQGPDPAKAAAIANSVAVLTARQAESLYRVFTLHFVAKAVPRPSPVHPQPKRNLLVGSAIGVFVALAAAFAVERLRPRPALAADEVP